MDDLIARLERFKRNQWPRLYNQKLAHEYIRKAEASLRARAGDE